MGKEQDINFKIGEVVVHRTNPKQQMIIVNDLYLACRWLDSNGTPHKSDFIPEELIRITES